MEVNAALAQATAEPKPPTWEEPQPLVTAIPAEPYPLHELPPFVGDAVREVADVVQCPVSLAATSALSAISVAVQAQADIERAPGLAGPSSINSVTIAESGEKKQRPISFSTMRSGGTKSRRQPRPSP